MTEIVLPNTDDFEADVSLYAPAQTNRSKWTGSRKVIGMPGAELWRGQGQIANIATEEQERPWRAWLYALRGPVNWFRCPLPCNQHVGAKPTVASGAGDGYTLPLTGMTANRTLLVAGQYLTVPLPSGRYRAVCLISPLTTDSSGNATATFEPALTETPTAGVTVESLTPFVPMSLVDPDQGFSTSQGVSAVQFNLEEYR